MPKMLSHDEMVAVIGRGGVMQMADGRTIHRVEDLPDAADLAVASDDADSRALVRSELERRQAEIKAQLDKIAVAESAEKSGGAARAQAAGAARAEQAGDEEKAKPRAAPLPEPRKDEPRAEPKKDK